MSRNAHRFLSLGSTLTRCLSVGSLVAYQLARFGVTPYIIEQDDKPNAPIYGLVSRSSRSAEVRTADRGHLAGELLPSGSDHSNCSMRSGSPTTCSSEGWSARLE